MAPRPPESFDAFVARLRAAIAGGGVVVRFGQYHPSHAVCVEEGSVRVRRLEHTAEEAEAYLTQHGIFMPEHAAQISRRRTIVFEAPSVDAVVS